MPGASVVIRPVNGQIELELFRRMAREYVTWLDVDLDFQGLEAELAGLPGKYAEPDGCILLAFINDEPAGCVALTPLEGNRICEMKRLWVRPGHRGAKLGQRLAEAIIQAGSERGYSLMRLDTLARLEAAIGIYRTLGFYETEPYYHNPLDGVLFMECQLP